jgi:aconitate hydratase
VPRALPTDDVLVVRERRAADAGAKKERAGQAAGAGAAVPVGWRGAQTLDVVDAASFLGSSTPDPSSGQNGKSVAQPLASLALVCATLDEVRTVAARVTASRVGESSLVRAVLAPFIPSGIVAVLSGLGIAAIEIDPAAAKGLRDPKDASASGNANGNVKAPRTILLPPPAQWGERESVSVSAGQAKLPLTWLALGIERSWASAGSASPPREVARGSARRP